MKHRDTVELCTRHQDLGPDDATITFQKETCPQEKKKQVKCV